MNSPHPALAPKRKRFYQDLSFQVFFGIAIGVILGHFWPTIGITMQPLGDAFIRLIQMVVGPIIFCTVVSGITGAGDLKKVGRVAIKALIYFEVITSLALVLGLVTINLLQPGVGMNIDMSTVNTSSVDSYITTARHFATTSEFLLNIIPKTMVSGFANGDILQILFFSVLFALGLAAAGERAKPMLTVIDSFASGLFWIIGLAMKVSPIAAFGAIAFTVSKFGFGSLISLGKLVAEFYLTCALFFILQILFFSVLFALGLAAAGERAKPMLTVIDSFASGLFWIIGLAMKVSPIAAFGAIAFTVSKFGFGSLISLGKLVAEFYLTCALFFILILWPVAHWSGFSLLKLMRYIRTELLLVIGTSSSESVFPQLLRKLEQVGCEKSVVGLVLPTGYSFNHDGTCLYFAAVSVFLAQATNTALGWQDQLALLAVLLLTSKGGAGVAGSAIAVLAATLAATNTIPVSSIAVILGVHRLLSSAFVFTNITGNAVATIVVANWERALDHKTLDAELNAGYIPPAVAIDRQTEPATLVRAG